MGSARLPNQKDIDSQILDLPNPLAMFWGFVLIFTVFIFAGSTLALFGLMAAGFLPWAIWPFLAVPVGLWVVMLALPVAWTSRRGALSTLEAVAMSAEAWMARAGYSVDLNGDGYIGIVQPPLLSAPEPVEEIRPVIIRNGVSRLLANQTPAIENIAEGVPVEEEVPEAKLQMQRKVWQLPKINPRKPALKVPQETLESFIDGVFIHGPGRSYWVAGRKLDRDVYDSLIALLEYYRLLEGRKPGSTGKLTVADSQAARKYLGLPGKPG